MKCLTIQVQLDNIDNFDEAAFLRHVRALGRSPEIDRSEINTPNFDDKYINFNFFTEELPLLWGELEAGLFQDAVWGPLLSATSIVACEGDQGWDDYLTLKHFDPSVTLDTLK